VSQARNAKSDANPPRILIVDDNETNRDLLVSWLGPHGYDLVQAADGGPGPLGGVVEVKPSSQIFCEIFPFARLKSLIGTATRMW
jgi:hypothetical protein